MLSHTRQAIDLLQPDGPPHEPKDGGHLSDFRDAESNNIDSIRDDIADIAFLRDPENTPVLSDLEREYGLEVNTALSEATRIALLKSAVYRRRTNGTDDDLQAALDLAGFDVTVYNNSPDGPAVDPAIILDKNFQMQAQDGTNYYAGNDDAYAGRFGGYLLVNGRVFGQVSAFYGAGEVYAGNDNAVAGYFEYLRQTVIEYPIPTDPADWPFVFFVGGDATFNPTTGAITAIAQAFIPSSQKNQFESIILKFKPLFSWCGVVVTYT